jgi:hypothetical protein
MVVQNHSLEFSYPIDLLIHLSYQLFFVVDIIHSKTPTPALGNTQPNIKFFPKMEAARGAPEQQMAAFTRGNSNSEDIQCQKCR